MDEDFSIIPITESEYNEWIVTSNNNYILEMIRGGKAKEEAEKNAYDDFHKLLPNGLQTEHHFIYSIRVSDKLVGTLWFGIKGPESNRKAYIYDIIIDEDQRGKGYGKKTLKFLEEEAKKLGLHHIGLHVFGHNKIARELYEKLGYEAKSLWLEKNLNENN